MKNISKHIRTILESNKNSTKAVAQEKYMKGVIKCYGLYSADLKKIFSTIWKEKIKDLQDEEKKDLGFEMFKENFSEEKQFGISILNKIAKTLTREDIPKIESVIEESVYDWATCDTLASRVIHEMIVKDPKIVELIKKWKDSDNLWVQRASCVSFVKLARTGEYKQDILEISESCVKSNERFVQLGNGWVLRQLSINHNDEIVEFIKKHYDEFSREGLRYAIEKMESKLKKSLMNYKKDEIKNGKKLKK
eukprot:gene846-9095_t